VVRGVLPFDMPFVHFRPALVSGNTLRWNPRGTFEELGKCLHVLCLHGAVRASTPNTHGYQDFDACEKTAGRLDQPLCRTPPSSRFLHKTTESGCRKTLFFQTNHCLTRRQDVE